MLVAITCFSIGGCPYLGDIGGEGRYKLPPWTSGAGVVYDAISYVVTLAGGYGMEPDAEGSFYLFNEFLAPRCLDGLELYDGKVITVEELPGPCQELLQPCGIGGIPCPDGPVGIIRRIVGLFGVEKIRTLLSGIVLPTGFEEEHPLKVDRVRIGWRNRVPVGWSPQTVGRAAPYVSVQVDLDRTTYLPPEPIETDKGIKIAELRLPRFSLELLFRPLASSYPESRYLALEKIVPGPYRAWSDPLPECGFNSSLPGCFPDPLGEDETVDDYYRQFVLREHLCLDGFPIDNVGLGIVEVGLYKTDGGTTWEHWCNACSPTQLPDYFDRYGEFHCLQVRVDGYEWYDDWNREVNSVLAQSGSG